MHYLKARCVRQRIVLRLDCQNAKGRNAIKHQRGREWDVAPLDVTLFTATLGNYSSRSRSPPSPKRSKKQGSQSWPCVFCLINRNWSFPFAWSIPHCLIWFCSGAHTRTEGGRCRVSSRRHRSLNPRPTLLHPDPAALIRVAQPRIIQSISFDQNCQLHSCHTPVPPAVAMWTRDMNTSSPFGL